jgi:hypothetical protein
VRHLLPQGEKERTTLTIFFPLPLWERVAAKLTGEGGMPAMMILHDKMIIDMFDL